MKVIALTGYKQSGKDTVAEIMRHALLPAYSSKLNFADAVKEEVSKATGVSLTEIEKNKLAFRPILQWWGTDFRRNMYGQQYWILKWLQAFNKLGRVPDYLFVTDLRFANEAAVIQELNGTVIRVHNPKTTSDGHASEVELDKLSSTHTIINNSTLADLDTQVRKQLLPLICPTSQKTQ